MAFQSEAEARASLQWPAIYNADQSVSWYGRDASYASTLDYFGNRALIDGTLVLSEKTQSMAPIAVRTGRKNVFDRRQQLYLDNTATAHAECGLAATLSLTYLAATDIFIHTGGVFEFGSVPAAGSDVAFQPDCSCTGGGGGGGDPIRDDVGDGSYDPYSAGTSPSTSSGCGEGGGGGGDPAGSGTQFMEGDYTGGETVDWGTGVGNGGASECGMAAQVRWVCIDVFVDGAWKKWSCGWGTTC